MAVGLITDPIQTEKILNDGSSDLIVIGCEVLKISIGQCVSYKHCLNQNFNNFSKQRIDGQSSRITKTNF